MDFGRMSELTLRVQHRHQDGTWGSLEPEPHHDPASHDPEREWVNGAVYVCADCGEEVRIMPPVEPSEGDTT